MKKTLIVLLVMASSAFVRGADNEKQQPKGANKATSRIEAAAGSFVPRLFGSVTKAGGTRTAKPKGLGR